MTFCFIFNVLRLTHTHTHIIIICVFFYHKQEFLFERKVKATDRTKTPEEIAKEEATKLHALESKRLARMEGDFLSEDEFSDISSDEEGGSDSSKKRRRNAPNYYNKDDEEVSRIILIIILFDYFIYLYHPI